MSDHRLTLLLHRWADGDADAASEVMEATYQQLRRSARGLLRNERHADLLRATELVHEAYLRLFHGAPVSPASREAFFKLMAVQMRRQLVDHARRQRAAKRGGHALLGVDAEATASQAAVRRFAGHDELLAIDEVLRRLGSSHPRAARVIAQRVIAGHTIEETAAMLGLSPGTVKREYAFARAWLRRELQDLPGKV